MTITKDKLKLLWNKKKNIDGNNDYIKRVEDILKALEIDQLDEIPESEHNKVFFGPACDGITEGQDSGGGKKSIENMKNKFDKYYNKQINAICTIVGAPERYKDFRVFSNASENSDWETSNLSVGINTPDNYFISNNYFYNIAKFIKQSKNKSEFDKIVGTEDENQLPLVVGWNDEASQENIDRQKIILKKKFVTKYLWMLGNKEDILTIFSLQSFYNLQQSGIFNEFGFEFSPDSNFDDFTNQWKEFSKKILEELNIYDNDKKLEFSKWLFLLSFSMSDIKNISDSLETGNQAVILWGPPGTGKTYESEEVVKELLKINVDENIEDYLFSNNEINDKGYYEIIQFHPNYTYQDFIGGIAPSLGNKTTSDTISYELREGIFKRFCDKANEIYEKERENEENKTKFIFIIDEINRAELSAVFGELLYALEYRGKSINLPYFGKFTIPSNVYIIGTMNNVDKSLVTFDLALRRRFGFFKLMPKLEVINEVLGEKVEKESLNLYYEKCINLNNSIKDTLDLGEDYQIGQAYFLKIKDFLKYEDIEKVEKLDDENKLIITSFELEKLWVYNIEPLLEEYLGMGMDQKELKEKLELLQKEFVEN